MKRAETAELAKEIERRRHRDTEKTQDADVRTEPPQLCVSVALWPISFRVVYATFSAF